MNVFVIKAILTVTLVLTASKGIAGYDVGNGGDVLECLDEETGIRSITLLDVYEAMNRYGLTLEYLEGESVEESVRSILLRLKSINPTRAKRYLNELGRFFSGDDWLPEVSSLLYDVTLEDIPDDQGYLFIPNGCKISQIVIQDLIPEIPGQKRFTINGDLWDNLLVQQKIALVIHELVYSEAIEEKTSMSWKVRYLAGNILSSRVELRTQEEWIEILKVSDFYENGEIFGQLHLRYGTIEFQEGRISSALVIPKTGFISGRNWNFLVDRFPQQVDFYPNGQAKFINIIADPESYLFFGDWCSASLSNFYGLRALFDEGGNVYGFDPNPIFPKAKMQRPLTFGEQVGSFCLARSLDGTDLYPVKVTKSLNCKNCSVRLYNSGSVKSIKGFHIEMWSEIFDKDFGIDFLTSGWVEKGKLLKKYVFDTDAGQRVEFPAGTVLKFNEEWLVISEDR